MKPFVTNVPKKPPSSRAVIAPAARTDIQSILRWSNENFGKRAAARYRILLQQALRDIDADPLRPGSRLLSETGIQDVRIYHLALSRDRVKGPKVHLPRHFLVYRSRTGGRIEVLRVLHDSRLLARHLSENQ